MSASTLQHRIRRLEKAAFGWEVPITHIGVNGIILPPTNYSQRVCDSVCEHCGIAMRQLLSRKRTRALCDARFAAALLMREANESYPAIAVALGWEVHGTAMNALKRANALMEADSGFASLVNLIRDKIGVDQTQR